MALLRETIKAAPEAERSAPGPTQKKFVRDTTGRAKYMLAGLIQSPNQTKPVETATAKPADTKKLKKKILHSLRETSGNNFKWSGSGHPPTLRLVSNGNLC